MNLKTHSLSLILVLFTLTGALQMGCAGSQLSRGAANALVPVADENKLGEQMVPEIEAELKISDNQALQSYIQTMGNKVATEARKRGEVPKGIKFTFTVVDDPKTVNAFAIPGGHIYMYTGLMKAADSEAEIAGVLGHEIAHVTRRHIAQQLVTLYGLDAVMSMALGENPGLIGSLVGNIAGQGYMLKNSRDAERDADQYGVNYMIAAGYNPLGFVSFFSKLGGSGGVPEFLSTHPDPSDRATATRKRIAAMDNVPKYTGKETWQKKRQEFGL